MLAFTVHYNISCNMESDNNFKQSIIATINSSPTKRIQHAKQQKVLVWMSIKNINECKSLLRNVQETYNLIITPLKIFRSVAIQT